MSAIIPKNKREELRIELTEFKGHQLVACRVWARESDTETVPTPKGLTVQVSLLPAILKALREAEQGAGRLGWIGGDHG